MNISQSNAAILMDFQSLAGSRIPSVDDVTAEMNRAWDTYNGKLKDPLLTRPGQPSDNVKFNGSSIIVDTGVAFLFGKGFAYTLREDAPDDGSRTPAETYLDKFWIANDKDEFIHKVAINGAGVWAELHQDSSRQPLPEALRNQPRADDRGHGGGRSAVRASVRHSVVGHQ